MFVVVVQDDNLIVDKVIKCDTMVEVQSTLEALEPDMDSEYLIVGKISNVTFYNSDTNTNYTYSFLKLENANSLLTEQI